MSPIWDRPLLKYCVNGVTRLYYIGLGQTVQCKQALANFPNKALTWA